jgi:hypothetical protein
VYNRDREGKSSRSCSPRERGARTRAGAALRRRTSLEIAAGEEVKADRREPETELREGRND